MVECARIFGWNMEQWAIALGRYPMPEATANGILKVKQIWKLSHLNEPGEISLVGVEPKKDWNAVAQLVSLPWQLVSSDT